MLEDNSSSNCLINVKDDFHEVVNLWREAMAINLSRESEMVQINQVKCSFK